MKRINVSGWWAVAVIAMAGAMYAGAITFTDVNEATYWGKTGIPALTAAIDANFAQLEAGYSGEAVAATTLSASGNATFSAAVTVIGGGVTSRWDNGASLIDATKLTGNISVARISNALTAPGAIGGTTPAAGTFTEVVSDGKCAVVGSNGTTGLMVLSGNVTKPATQLSTNSFAVAFASAPTLMCTYTEGTGTNIPMIVTSTTVTNFIVFGTASIDFSYVAVGARP